MTNYIARGRSVVMPLTNETGGSVGEGDVVIIDSANPNAFTTTTTEGLSSEMVGVVLETIANNAEGRVCVGGFVEKINLNNSASYGDYLYTDNIAKFGIASSTLSSGAIGQAMDSGATPSAVLWIKPERFVLTDPAWQAEGDLLVGTGAGVAVIKSVGADGEVLTANSGATGGVSWDPISTPAVDPVGFWISAPFLAAYTPTTGANTISTSPSNENTLIMLSGGYPNVHDGIYLQVDEETQTGTMLIAPYTGTLTLYLVFHVDMGPASGGNLYYSYDVSVHSAGDLTYTDDYPGTFTTMAVTNSQDQILYTQISGGTYSVTAGDSISVRIIADRNHASDTAGDTISLWQVAGVYV